MNDERGMGFKYLSLDHKLAVNESSWKMKII